MEHRPDHQFRTRANALTEHDIEDIVNAVKNATPHTCRFGGVTEEEFYESVKFYKYWNRVLTSGGNLAAKIVFTALIVFICGVAANGFISTIISWVSKKP